MGPLGMGEIVVLFVLALLIFGPKKLPELGKTFGKGMAEFKRASNELKTTFKREMDNIEHETSDVKSIASDVGQDINTSYYDNEDDYYSDYDYGGGATTSSVSGSTKQSDSDASTESGEASSGQHAANGSPEGSESGDASPAVSDSNDGGPVSGLPEAEDGTASKSA